MSHQAHPRDSPRAVSPFRHRPNDGNAFTLKATKGFQKGSRRSCRKTLLSVAQGSLKPSMPSRSQSRAFSTTSHEPLPAQRGQKLEWMVSTAIGQPRVAGLMVEKQLVKASHSIDISSMRDEEREERAAYKAREISAPVNGQRYMVPLNQRVKSQRPINGNGASRASVTNDLRRTRRSWPTLKRSKQTTLPRRDGAHHLLCARWPVCGTNHRIRSHKRTVGGVWGGRWCRCRVCWRNRAERRAAARGDGDVAQLLGRLVSAHWPTIQIPCFSVLLEAQRSAISVPEAPGARPFAVGPEEGLAG